MPGAIAVDATTKDNTSAFISPRYFVPYNSAHSDPAIEVAKPVVVPAPIINRTIANSVFPMAKIIQPIEKGIKKNDVKSLALHLSTAQPDSITNIMRKIENIGIVRA